jgi:hypothetical protein
MASTSKPNTEKTMDDDSTPDGKVKSRKEPSDPGYDSEELFPRPSLRSPRAKENSDHHKSPRRGRVYLWLCCEGWMRFGPFEWLRFDDTESTIIDPDGEVVAKMTNGYWVVSSGQGGGMQFSNPTITSSREHPHRNSGDPPWRR